MLRSVSSIYNWSENSSQKSKAKIVEIEELLDVNGRHLGFIFLKWLKFLLEIYTASSKKVDLCKPQTLNQTLSVQNIGASFNQFRKHICMGPIS